MLKKTLEKETELLRISTEKLAYIKCEALIRTSGERKFCPA
jgi:hypothetical protein